MTTYDSKAEESAAPDFTRLGCIPAGDAFYPVTFTDADGTTFNARPDFFHPATGIYCEFKAAALNGCKTKHSADKQLAGREDYRRRRGEAVRMIDRLRCQWNHAAEKVAITQSAIAAAGGAIVLVFASMPDADTIKRLNSWQVFWLVLGTSQWRQFASFLKFASAGIPARMVYAHPEAGRPLHEFRTQSFAG